MLRSTILGHPSSSLPYFHSFYSIYPDIIYLYYILVPSFFNTYILAKCVISFITKIRAGAGWRDELSASCRQEVQDRGRILREGVQVQIRQPVIRSQEGTSCPFI